ncbi:MAG: tRNA (adenosine(37)-N6)-threonylcarbamoyltransferase complex ATPase subunit type 1 TsaE [Aggregatilineales bacterium]
MPILREGELDIISYSAEQTGRLGHRLGTLLSAGDVVCLSGDMGAGKTVFSGGVGRGWGAIHPLTSPTYNLVHQHQRRKDKQRLYHLDCYRLNGPEDADSIGLDDMLESDGIIVLEWAERLKPVLPRECLWIHIRVMEETRRNFVMEGDSAYYKSLIRRFRALSFGF